MLHIKDRPSGDLSGKVFPPKSLVWYDGRNQRLVAAIKDLRELQKRPRLWIALIWPAAALALCVGLSILQELSVQGLTLCALAVVLLFIPWLAKWWRLTVYRIAAHELYTRLMKGDFGHEFMTEDEPTWKLLADLFDGHGIDMVTQIFANPATDIELIPRLSALLWQTQTVRQQARDRNITNPDDDLLVYLREVATPAVSNMASDYKALRQPV